MLGKRSLRSRNARLLPSKSAAFTLVELSLVLVIVLILFGIGTPLFIGKDHYEVRLFYDQAVAAVRYANKMAVASGCDVQVDISGNDLVLLQRENCTSGNFNQAVLNPTTKSLGFSISAPNGVSINSTDVPFFFNALGQAQGAMGISDVSLNVDSLVINVVGETGFVITVASS